jgi:tRNA G10  N-methylase Trm11
MEYLIRFVQTHETFRRPETEAIAELYGLPLEWVIYDEDVRSDRYPFPARWGGVAVATIPRSSPVDRERLVCRLSNALLISPLP